MVLYRLNEAHPALRLRGEMDRVFGDVFGGVAGMAPQGWFGRRAFPAFNVWEDDTTLVAEAEVPGLQLEDIDVMVQGDELIVKGARKTDAEEGATYHRRERGVGQFSRMVRLPVEVDADKVTARLSDGVLRITLPKAQAVLPRKIEVKSS